MYINNQLLSAMATCKLHYQTGQHMVKNEPTAMPVTLLVDAEEGVAEHAQHVYLLTVDCSVELTSNNWEAVESTNLQPHTQQLKLR